MPSLTAFHRTAALIAAVAALLLAAPAAHADDFVGTTAGFGKLTASVSDGTVTAFQTRTGRLQTCSGKADSGSSYDPQELLYAGPAVAIAGGKVHLEGTSQDGYGDVFQWKVDAALSLDHTELTGTATVSGDTMFDKQCVGTWNFDAIIAPRTRAIRTHHTFTGIVSFDYSHGVVTHLSGLVSVTCADTSLLGAMADTTAYRQDPIRVSRAGRFWVSGAVLDDYGVVNHYKLSGRIHGTSASGTYSSYRFDSLANATAKCTGHGSWRANAASIATTSGPAAFYDVVPFRYGRTGAWSYYLVVKVSGCAHANRVRIAIAHGPAKTTVCHGQVRLGPLVAKRTYTVAVTALRLRGRTIVKRSPAVPTRIYLPGEDGDWIRIR